MSLAAASPTSLRAMRPGAQVLRAWLWLMAFLVLTMVLVGGATRLTGSGLSITEWRPVTGALPPLSASAWGEEFDKYRQSPQYQILNRGMSLDDFKVIYWWEWSHRQLGRAMGLVFALGFAGLVLSGTLRGRLAWAILGVGALGGLQGMVGWLMVASGLKPGMTAVAPIKLMLHLVMASVIFACLVWLATGLSTQARPSASVGQRRAAFWILGLVIVQIALGALVAGSRAGLTFNTWPLMDGRLVPSLDRLFSVTPWIENFVDNVALVQFNHRMMAYAIVVLALWHAWDTQRDGPGSAIARRAVALAGLIVLQAVIGVITLLAMVPLSLGLLHQGFAMLVLGMAVVHARACMVSGITWTDRPIGEHEGRDSRESRRVTMSRI